MKEFKKMNLGELKKLSRSEMKTIMAGSGVGCVNCGCLGASCKINPCCNGFFCNCGQVCC